GPWDLVFSGQSSGNTIGFESFSVGGLEGRHVRIIGFGNSSNEWNRLVEVAIYSDASNSINGDDSSSTDSGTEGTTYYVSPTGTIGNSGLTEQEPLPGIQAGLDLAQPGDRVKLLAGHYFEDPRSVRSGMENQPIIIEGTWNAILQGTGTKARVFMINHSHLQLHNFSIDGRVGDGTDVNHYRDKLLYVHGQATVGQGPEGIKVMQMLLRNAGDECVRFRYYVTGAEFAHNHVENCGMRDFHFNGGGKNGEALYIGTSSTQWNDGKNPENGPDRSNHNWVHHNTFVTNGNECVDIKEGAEHNLVEFNDCSGQLDERSAGFGSRSDNNVFRYNLIHDNVGAGIRIGGHYVDGRQWGVGNEIYGNTITYNLFGGIKLMTSPQQKICDNTMSYNEGGDMGGTYGNDYDPTAPCE
ncbi:MAG: right-handed parallel beta-helix repeat-containing protein, partial [Ketobacteraceae bacterium]|nr:right-handed parallel beta-helix repeat-containing protein [Ketobacteraceae bacterium]